MERLSAVVTHAHGNSCDVQELTHVVGMNSGHVDADQAHALHPGFGTEEANAVDLGDTPRQPTAELGLPRLDPVHADRLQIAHGLRPGDGLTDALGAGLEANG